MKLKKTVSRSLTYIILAIGAAIIAFPLYLTIITSLKTNVETSQSFFAFPQHFYLGNFQKIIEESNYPTYLFNSVIITVCSLIILLAIIPATSFAISRNSSKTYFKVIYIYLLAAIFVPFQVIMLPVVKTMYAVNLMNQIGLIILYSALGISQGIFLCVGYLKSIPFDLEEAAYIDGCTVISAFFKIIFPLMKPIISTVVILDALWIWNDFQLPLVILNKTQDYWTLPLFQYNFKGQYSTDYNSAFAAFFLSMVPIVILYAVFQKYIISGLTEGSIKT